MNSRYVRFGVNLLARDKVVLARMASQEGETMSSVIRRLVRREAQRLGLLGQGPRSQAPSSSVTEAGNV